MVASKRRHGDIGRNALSKSSANRAAVPTFSWEAPVVRVCIGAPIGRASLESSPQDMLSCVDFTDRDDERDLHNSMFCFQSLP